MVEIKQWIRLSIAEGMSKNNKIMLLKHFDKPGDIFEASDMNLIKHGIRNTKALSAFRSNNYKKEAECIYNNVIKHNVKILTYNDKNYPEYLKEIHDPPILLYYKGDIAGNDVCIGIVGSRRSSEYGKNVAENFAERLARTGFIIVSGMARGIDTKAHEGALKAGGKTYAIIGSGIDITYPPENKKIMKAIIENGAVISEFPPGTMPNSYNFPIRNRIISGISLGIVVVEAGLKSGSLITANLALEQGRDVFAVPGNINKFISKGTNKLIKEGAKLVSDVDDILDEYKTFFNIDKSTQIGTNVPIKKLSTDERKIIELLKIQKLYLEDISLKTAITLQNLSYLSLCLEMKGIIAKEMSGQYFLRMEE